MVTQEGPSFGTFFFFARPFFSQRCVTWWTAEPAAGPSLTLRRFIFCLAKKSIIVFKEILSCVARACLDIVGGINRMNHAWRGKITAPFV